MAGRPTDSSDPAPGGAAGLLAWLAGPAGEADAAVAALHRSVAARHAVDRARLSDVLEPSFSVDPAGVHLHRFSYAFPGHRADASVPGALRALCAPFGPAARDACEAVLRAAASAAVAQPMFGFADDGGGRRRVKLYLQFHPGQGPRALGLAARMLGRDLSGAGAGAPLHLLGLDLGAGGLAGAKLYFARGRVAPRAVQDLAGPVPLARDLEAAGVAALEDVLVIHRLAGPDEPLAAPVEIDFALPGSGVTWPALQELPAARALLAPHPELRALEARYRPRVRRISASTGAGDKLNVYYALPG